MTDARGLSAEAGCWSLRIYSLISRYVLSHWSLTLAILLFTGCGSAPHVVLYTSQDQFYAEPILREFTRETGIEVRAVFDTESAKTAGLANRLRGEKGHPRCNVFWSNEEMHARMLAREGVFSEEAIRTAGYRTRRIVVNTNLLSLAEVPSSLLQLTNESWRGRVVLAFPLYGTTSSHFLGLRQLWGEETWRRWCQAIQANGAKIVDGNSVVVRLVGSGEAWLGLTDSDDIAAGKRSGLPIEQARLTDEFIVIPNTITLVASTPEAERLVDFLMRTETLARLVEAGALEGLGACEGKRIDWTEDTGEVMEALKKLFLRS